MPQQRSVRSALAVGVVSQLGTGVHFVAQVWLFYQVQRNGTVLSFVSVMSLLAPLLLDGLGGHPIERFRARRMLLFTRAALGAVAGV